MARCGVCSSPMQPTERVRSCCGHRSLYCPASRTGCAAALPGRGIDWRAIYRQQGAGSASKPADSTDRRGALHALMPCGRIVHSQGPRLAGMRQGVLPGRSANCAARWQGAYRKSGSVKRRTYCRRACCLARTYTHTGRFCCRRLSQRLPGSGPLQGRPCAPR